MLHQVGVSGAAAVPRLEELQLRDEIRSVLAIKGRIGRIVVIMCGAMAVAAGGNALPGDPVPGDELTSLQRFVSVRGPAEEI